jgi:hypothetical protein
VILTPLPTFCTVGARTRAHTRHIHAHAHTRAHTQISDFDTVAHGLFSRTGGCTLPTPVIHDQCLIKIVQCLINIYLSVCVCLCFCVSVCV